MATLRNAAISLLRIAGITRIARSLQAFSRDRTRILSVIPLQALIYPTSPIPWEQVPPIYEPRADPNGPDGGLN
jgi:hypothetical protein